MGLSADLSREISNDASTTTTRSDQDIVKKYTPIANAGKVVLAVAVTAGFVALAILAVLGIVTGGIPLLAAVVGAAIYTVGHFGINHAVNKASEEPIEPNFGAFTNFQGSAAHRAGEYSLLDTANKKVHFYLSGKEREFVVPLNELEKPGYNRVRPPILESITEIGGIIFYNSNI